MSVDIFLYDDGHEPLLFKDIEKYEITIVQWSVNGSDNVVYIPQNPTGKQQIHVQFAPDSGASAGAVSVLVTHKKGGGCFEPVLLTKSGESLLRLYIPPPSNTAKLPAKILDWVEKHYVSAEIPDAIRDRLIECARFCVSELAGSEDVSAQASLSDLIARLFPYPPMEFSGADCLVVAGSGTDGLQTSSFRLTTPLRDSIPSHPSLGLSLIRVVPLTSSASACRALGKTLQLPDGQTSNPMIGRICSLAYSHGHWRLAAGGSNGVIAIYEHDGGGWRRVQVLYAAPIAVLGLAFSPDGNRLAAVSLDGTCVVYDTKSERRSGPSQSLPVTEKNGRGVPTAVAFSPEGTHLVVATGFGESPEVYLLETAGTCSPRLVHTSNREGGIHALSFRPRTGHDQEVELLIASVSSKAEPHPLVVEALLIRETSTDARELGQFELPK